jgi:hypothetical protein
MRDAKSQYKVANSLLPIAATNTADATGLGVDTNGFQSALMVLTLGVPLTALSGSIYWVVAFQEHDENTAGHYTNIADADLEGGVNLITVNADGEASRSISRGYKGDKRWLRIIATGTGSNTNGTPMSAVIVLGHPKHAATPTDGAQT